MDDSIIRSCVLFFLVTLDDESLVYPSTELALTNARRAKFQKPQVNLLSLVISEATSIIELKKFKSIGDKRELQLVHLPKQELLKDLKSLRTKVTDKLFIPFAWSEIVKAPNALIADGLGLSAGTVEYRSHEVLKQWAEVS